MGTKSGQNINALEMKMAKISHTKIKQPSLEKLEANNK
jgi:hypothetical protein